MAPSKIRRALGAVKDQTSIGLAKVGSSNSLADLDVAIVKATRHEEYPAEERHVREIISLTSYSRAFITACVNTLARRLNRTKNWTVALKTLMLIHRLLAEGDPAYEQEIFFSTRRGTRILNMSDFRDQTSEANSWDYSAFVRTYALYLDERLEFRMQGKRGKRSGFEFDEDEDDENETDKSKNSHSNTTPVPDMKTEDIFSRINHLQQLLERFLACRPTGEAKGNRVVLVALYAIVKESFQIYYDMTEILGILIERFMELEVHDCVKVHEIFYRVSKQFDELGNFYHWCRNMGIARTSEYPEVEKIAMKKLDLMDEFIRDKAALAQTKKNRIAQLEGPAPVVVEPKEPEPVVEDMNAVKALPAPEGWQVTPVEEKPEPKEEEKEKEKKEINNTQEVGDLLNLGDGGVTTEQHGNQLALALFDGGPALNPAAPAWEAFTADDSADWETALVQSASGLSHQKTNFGGGFDMLLLDGMYQQGTMVQATMGGTFGASGSASSVAFGSIGRPAMLALPAPPTSNDGASTMSADPFAASLAVAPPTYVQMSEMEKKQKLLMEEQLLWQQYARDGMPGHLGMQNFQGSPYPYNNGGYARSY